MADEAQMPDIDTAIGDIVRHRPVRRPVIETRPPEKPSNEAPPDGSNPFVAVSQLDGQVAAFHEHLIAVVTKLAGEPPPFQPLAHEPGGGLLGLTTLSARSMSERIRHCETMLQRVEEPHLR